jgi:hypothetical protein
VNCLTILLHDAGDRILARGIIGDETVFEHLPFASIREVLAFVKQCPSPEHVRLSVPYSLLPKR